MRGVRAGRGVLIPEGELRVRFSRSGGPGGQHVNKVSTRVEILFDVRASSALTTPQKETILKTLGSRLLEGGVLRVAADESRSQWANRRAAALRLGEILETALRVRKKRKPTRPHAGSHEERLRAKRLRGSRKEGRRGADPGEY
ncbi:MAG: alternative ribosome rescue aminoacyl-tRNA hydrolase ArfB [Bacteroidota bacterium]